MLAANVLCIKKRKKKSYCVPALQDNLRIKNGKDRRRKSNGGMLHITEDTPADMLSGAMDLTIHLPSGEATKMCVERSTPMMDLLVQITTNHQLQITNYTLQPLQTVLDSNYPERVLSYYPNTPIGALDTQQIRVVPKTRTLPVVKNVPPGHQPFESTFRLKVHLPRNQLFVTRVSRNVHIEDIMRKVCQEKNLDPSKYEVRHPGNLDEVLDSKLTLNDYMITEIHLVVKGSNNLTQFSSNDIMILRKEEERKQLHNKTGGGVFNLIFRRNKSTPDHSAPVLRAEDSRTTAARPQTAPAPLSNGDVHFEKPKVPQRKRRPAPKPPQATVEKPQETERVGSTVSENSTSSDIGIRNNEAITICHSRHSSDSSGYHETSILSDHCNTSLPRKNRPDNRAQTLNRHSESVGNLANMSAQSRSTSSLAFPGRKKKAPPPPPTTFPKSVSTTSLEKPSPVVASQTPVNSSPSRTDLQFASQGTQKPTHPPPAPRRRKGPLPLPEPRNSIIENEKSDNDSFHSCPYHEGEVVPRDETDCPRPLSNMSTTDILKSLEYLNLDDQGNEIKPPEIIGILPKSPDDVVLKKRVFKLNLVDQNIDDDNTSVATVSPMKDDYYISTESDVSISFDRHFKKPVRDFSIASLRSSESVLFEEGRMKKWGSWEKLDEPPPPPSTSPPTDLSYDCNTTLTSVDLVKSDADSISSQQRKGESSKVESTQVIEDVKTNEITIPYNLETDYINYDKSPQDSGNSSDISEKSKLDEELIIPQDVEEDEWNLPSPPKAFKDSETVPLEEDKTEKAVIITELTEKLKNIKERRDEENNETDGFVLTTLSLENLEKRKTLVYNRELATSLKLYNSDKSEQLEVSSDDAIPSRRSSNNSTSTLPNFKITTYDEPKKIIKVFEDDTIRSNSEKTMTLNRNAPLQKTHLGRSMENVSVKSIIDQKQDDIDRRYTRRNQYEKPVNRSGSFKMEQNGWSPSKPVTRSKSQVALKRGDSIEDSLSKSNSLFDVSGLQSLEVMRKIQSKLNTPNTSMETLTRRETEEKIEVKKPQENVPKKFQYTGPPSINMATWSERPRIPVSVKEDADYKLGQGCIKPNPKLMVSSQIKKPVNHSTKVDVLPKYNYPIRNNDKNVSIRVNSTEPIMTQNNGNVLIKIGQNGTKDYRDVLYQSPSGQRPHSVAFPSDFDVSRLPVVRAVELKKPYQYSSKTSITHLNQSNGETYGKTISRTKSFAQTAPISNNNRHSWQPTTNSPSVENYTTNRNVPFSKFNLRRTDSSKIVEDEKPKYDEIAPPPPQMPKIVPKKISNRQFVPVLDPREELLKSIRNFGGKKGLSSRQA